MLSMLHVNHGPVFSGLIVFQADGFQRSVAAFALQLHFNRHFLHTAVAGILVLAVRYLPESVFHPQLINRGRVLKDKRQVGFSQLGLFCGELEGCGFLAVRHALRDIRCGILAHDIAGGIHADDRHLHYIRSPRNRNQ